MNDNLYVMKIDGKRVFFVESGVSANTSDGYVPKAYMDAKKEKISKIAYYGYTLTDQTYFDYALTQVMIWEELGDQLVSTSIPNYQERKAEILTLVDKHDILPSWHNQEGMATVGESLTLVDDNQVLSGMRLMENSTGMALNQTDNTRTISLWNWLILSTPKKKTPSMCV